MITIEDIRAGRISKGRRLFYGGATNANGTPQCWRVTSIKLWKTRPAEFVLGMSRGLYRHDRITDTNGWAKDFYLTEHEAVSQIVADKALKAKRKVA